MKTREISNYELLEFIRAVEKPTYPKIKQFLGVTSNQSVSDRLHRMEKMGMIKIQKGKKAGITVLQKKKPSSMVICNECGNLKEVPYVFSGWQLEANGTR